MTEELICGCGKPLYQVKDDNGNILGVTHTPEDEDWHNQYFSGMIVIIPNNN